jgi:hypothetical protein
VSCEALFWVAIAAAMGKLTASSPAPTSPRQLRTRTARRKHLIRISRAGNPSFTGEKSPSPVADES